MNTSRVPRVRDERGASAGRPSLALLLWRGLLPPSEGRPRCCQTRRPASPAPRRAWSPSPDLRTLAGLSHASRRPLPSLARAPPRVTHGPHEHARTAVKAWHSPESASSSILADRGEEDREARPLESVRARRRCSRHGPGSARGADGGRRGGGRSSTIGERSDRVCDPSRSVRVVTRAEEHWLPRSSGRYFSRPSKVAPSRSLATLHANAPRTPATTPLKHRGSQTRQRN